MRRGRWTALAIAVVAVLAVWHLQAPPRTTEAYVDRGARTVGSLRSQVETARIWTATVADERTLLTSALVGLEEVDRDAASVLADFEALDPPTGAGRVRRSVVAAGGAATDVLTAVRIAAQDGEWVDVAASRRDLGRLGGRLDRLERELRR